jgi:hypothetical protein
VEKAEKEGSLVTGVHLYHQGEVSPSLAWQQSHAAAPRLTGPWRGEETRHEKYARVLGVHRAFEELLAEQVKGMASTD